MPHQHVDLSLAPGDTCLIREGIYHETLVPRSSGTSNAPITFAAYANEKVIISGADPVTNWIASSHGIFMTKVGSVLPNGRNEVFADGTMIPQARHPQHGNGGLLHPATLDLQIDGQNSNVIASSAFGGHRSNFWAGAWFYGGVGDKWSWQCARVLSSSGNTITVDESTKSQ